MNKLRIAINNLLKAIHPNVLVKDESRSRVFFQIAPKDAIYPYLVYDFPNSFTSEEQEIFNLDVDVWDMPGDGDTTTIELLAGEIWKKLHKYMYLDDNIQFTLYRENRLPLTDDDPRLRRRKLIFQLRYYDRRLNDE